MAGKCNLRRIHAKNSAKKQVGGYSSKCKREMNDRKRQFKTNSCQNSQKKQVGGYSSNFKR
jgi:hypothetical protein